MGLKKNIAVSENGFVFDASSGNTFVTNEIGVEIIEMVKHEKPMDEIKRNLLNRYEIDDIDLEKDLLDFVGMLGHYQLIEK